MKRGQLVLSGFVVLFAIMAFIVVMVMAFTPVMVNITGADAAYSGNLKYLAYLFPAILVGGGIVMFFAANAVLR